MDKVEKEERIELLRAKLNRINGSIKTQIILDELYRLTRNEN